MNEIFTIIEHQTIKVAKNRDISNNTISIEDKDLLLDILFIDSRKNEKINVFKRINKNTIKATSIVGSITLKNNLIVEILPKFAKGDINQNNIKKFRKTLINVIKVSNNKNFISSSSISSKIKVDEMPLINYIIELFSETLLNELRKGLYFNYSKKINHSSIIKGKVLLSKTLQNNFIDKSKMYIEYRNHNINNLLMQIFKSLIYLLLKDNTISYNAKNNLLECYSILQDVEIINLKLDDFEKIVFNRLNENFENLFTQAKFIFSKYIPFTTNINSAPFWSILFNMDYLFEKFLAYLFRKSNIKVQEQFSFIAFINENYNVRGRPDFILKNKDDKISVVADAKWKILSDDKILYGLNSSNFWQLYSYMNLIQENEINGYFIVPKIEKNINDEIEFQFSFNDKKNIKILSIDFSLDFKNIINNYKFKLENNILSFDNDKNSISNESEIILNKLEKEFLKLIENHNENKKNYITGITYAEFQKEYPKINELLAKTTYTNFKTNKNQFLKNFIKLSKNKIRGIFKFLKTKIQKEEEIKYKKILNLIMGECDVNQKKHSTVIENNKSIQYKKLKKNIYRK
jgi:5-methylcytosine-specific restriction enzyme subunit McrC